MSKAGKMTRDFKIEKTRVNVAKPPDDYGHGLPFRHVMGPGSFYSQDRYGESFDGPTSSGKSVSDVFGKHAAQGSGLRLNKGARGGE